MIICVVVPNIIYLAIFLEEEDLQNQKTGFLKKLNNLRIFEEVGSCK
jgi:hypothetical protein